jgi:DUF1009 family protein
LFDFLLFLDNKKEKGKNMIIQDLNQFNDIELKEHYNRSIKIAAIVDLFPELN